MNFVNSKMYCVFCAKEGLNVYRKQGQLREAGHLKKLWCCQCKQERNFCECLEFGKYTEVDFLTEYLGENFSKDGNRIKDFSKFKQDLRRNDPIKYDDIRNRAYQIIDEREVDLLSNI